MDQKSHIKEQARVRQARRRARLKTEGVTVTVTLTHEEASMLEELKQVRRMGREPYSPNEFFQLLLIRNWQSWQADKGVRLENGNYPTLSLFFRQSEFDRLL